MKIIGKTFNSLLCGIYSYKHTVELCFQNFSVSVRVLIATETQIYVQICPPPPNKKFLVVCRTESGAKITNKSFSFLFSSLPLDLRHPAHNSSPSLRPSAVADANFTIAELKLLSPPSSVPAALQPPHKYHNTPLSTQLAVNNAEEDHGGGTYCGMQLRPSGDNGEEN